MEQKYVIEHLKKLESLSGLELEQRDLYLRQLNLGEIEGPMTGNIYLDKPYTARYREGLNFDFNPYETLYNTFVASIKGREEEIAIVQPDIGRVMTYGEILSEVDKTAAGLAKKGISEGSNLGMFFSNSIEEAIFLLAASKLGAVSKWIDYTKDPGSIIASVTEAKLDMLIIEDMLKPLEQAINLGKLPTVICGNTGELAENHITHEKLKALGEGLEVEPAQYKPNMPAVIITSSGTTGTPKPIVHGNEQINFAARRMMYSNFNLDKDHIVMVTIPPHIGLGLITSLYTNLISGAKLAMIHCNSPEDSMHKTVGFLMNYKNIVKDLFQNSDLKLIIFGAPIHVSIIASINELKDLSFMDGFLAAGSKLTKEELAQFEEVYATKGYTHPISIGYGRNEECGAVAINDPVYNANGAGGYPVIGTDVLIVDPKTFEPLPVGAEGKILERSNSSFLYYHNLPKQTEEAYVDIYGIRYADTKDLGYMAADGFVYITGRETRVFERFNTKISIDAIEGKVRMLPFIKDCAGIVIDQCTSSEKLALFVEPTEEASRFCSTSTLLEQISPVFADIDRPDFIYIASIPYMNNGKVDYQLLSSQLDDFGRKRN